MGLADRKRRRNPVQDAPKDPDDAVDKQASDADDRQLENLDDDFLDSPVVVPREPVLPIAPTGKKGTALHDFTFFQITLIIGNDMVEMIMFASLPTGKRKSRRGKFVQMTTLKPRGAEGGPKRTPPNLGDAWQKQDSYEVEQVRFRVMACTVSLVVDILPFLLE